MDTDRKYSLSPDSYHLHWTIWRYSSIGGPDQFSGVTSAEICARDEAEARKIAATLLPIVKRLTPDAGYFVRSVIEHFPGQCPSFSK